MEMNDDMELFTVIKLILLIQNISCECNIKNFFLENKQIK